MSNSASSTSAADGSVFNILFTCAGRRVAIIRAFRDALDGLGLAGSLVATDVTMSAPAMHVVDAAEIVPPVHWADYLDHVLKQVRRHHVRLVVPLTDLDLMLLAESSGRFAELGCTVMIAEPSIVQTCRDKIAFADLVGRAGLPSIRTMTLAAFRAAPFYPCFAKPISGSAAIGTKVLSDEADLDAHVASFGDELMIQEYVEGAEYTLDVYRRRDGVICAVVPRQRLEVRAGEVAKSLTVNDPELIAAAVEIIEHLPGLWGVFNLQCRRSAGGEVQFFELNPRFGGGAPLALAAGVNLPQMLISELIGRTVEPAVGQFTDRLLMTRYDEAIFTRIDDPASLPGYDQPIHR